MYDASGPQGNQGRRTPRAGTPLDKVVLETRCQRCRSLILAERIDPLVGIPVVDEKAQIICASCTTSEGRRQTS
ncbi:MAG: hypothetical protein WB565_01375 [Acidimicrobiales bacterium]